MTHHTETQSLDDRVRLRAQAGAVHLVQGDLATVQACTTRSTNATADALSFERESRDSVT